MKRNVLLALAPLVLHTSCVLPEVTARSHPQMEWTPDAGCQASSQACASVMPDQTQPSEPSSAPQPPHQVATAPIASMPSGGSSGASSSVRAGAGRDVPMAGEQAASAGAPAAGSGGAGGSACGAPNQPCSSYGDLCSADAECSTRMCERRCCTLRCSVCSACSRFGMDCEALRFQEDETCRDDHTCSEGKCVNVTARIYVPGEGASRQQERNGWMLAQTFTAERAGTISELRVDASCPIATDVSLQSLTSDGKPSGERVSMGFEQIAATDSELKTILKLSHPLTVKAGDRFAMVYAPVQISSQCGLLTQAISYTGGEAFHSATDTAVAEWYSLGAGRHVSLVVVLSR